LDFTPYRYQEKTMNQQVRRSLFVTIVTIISFLGSPVGVLADKLPGPAAGDPIWCPVGVIPRSSTSGCSPSYSTFTGLIAWLAANDPDRPGVIWFERTYNSAAEGVTGFTLDGTSFARMDHHPLTIQGGWNGAGTSSVDHGDPSVFSGDFLHILHWQSMVTVDTITVSSAGDTGLRVHTTGEIDLAYITSNGHHAGDSLSFGAYLDNGESAGPAAVNLRGSNVFNGNDAGLFISSKGRIDLNDLTVNRNGWEVTSPLLGGYGAYIDNTRGSASVQMTGSNEFNDNQGYGLRVVSNDAITIETVAASRNEFIGAWLQNDFGAGDVILKWGNEFFDNGEHGLRVWSAGRISLNYLTASANGVASPWPYYRDGVDLITPENTSVTCSTISRHAGYGIDASGVAGSLTLGRVAFFDNATGEYAYGGLPLIGSEGCGVLPRRVVEALHDSIIALDCSRFDGTEVILPDGRRVVFGCPTAGDAGIRFEKLEPLPGPLPDDEPFVSAVDLSLAEGGQVQEIAPGPLTISFPVPKELQGADFVVLYWDGKEWVDLSTARFEDGRKVIVPGFQTGDGRFETQINFMGFFVLSKK
jgi:hypothetical protein